MRKNVFGRQFKRDTNERKALFKSLISSLILNGSIKTTMAKAKAIKRDVDKIITIAKKGESYKRSLLSHVSEDAVGKAIFDLAPRFEGRKGGYSRIIKIGRRLSDNAEMVLMEWVIKSQASNLKSRKLESSKEVGEEKTPKTQKKTEAMTRKKVAKK